MAFTTKEFPGRVFSDLTEYNRFIKERELLKKQLFLGTTRASKITKENAGITNKKAGGMEKE
jgi:hypothetical protein